MKRLIVHIGYMKTATTSLQINCFTPLRDKDKIEYLNHTIDTDYDKLGQYNVNNIVSFILGTYHGEGLQKELLELEKIKSNTTLLSNENISCFSEKYPSTSSLAGATSNADKIHGLLSPYFDKIEIIMTIRDQKTMIMSFYTQVYLTIVNFQPTWGDFDVWFTDNFKQKSNNQGQFLDYHAMFTAYANYFGKENIHVLVYEDLLHNKNCFYQRLANIFVVKRDEIKELFESSVQNKTKKTNKGSSETEKGDLHAKLFSIAHRFFKKKDSKLFWITKKLFKILIPNKLLHAKIGSGVTVSKLTDYDETFIKSLFNQSNEQLIAHAGLDRQKMIQYGYISES